MLQFNTRNILFAFAFLSTVLAMTAYFQATTNWNRLVPWNYESKFEPGKHTVFETWVKSLMPGAGCATLLFAGMIEIFQRFTRFKIARMASKKPTHQNGQF